MASFVSQTEKTELADIFESIFDTFSRNIIVYKESIKTLNSSDTSNFVFGFGETQSEDSYSYTEVTGIFPAKIRYKDQIANIEQNINVFVSDGDVTIKVREDCKDFINSGKTEKFVFDNKTFVLDSPDEKPRRFLDSKYYVFSLKVMK